MRDKLSKMTVNDYFDKIFCINLKKRVDRWQSCVAEFQKHNLRVERFEAMRGKKITTGWMTGPRVGCCQSHANILKIMVKNNFKRILILEDDVELAANFQEMFIEKIKFVPDYDMLYFCANNPKNFEKINDHVAKIKSALSTVSYAISLNFAKKMIPKIEEFKEPVDCVYSQNTPNSRCYIFVPYLTQQKSGYSDIEKKFTDYSAVININYVNKN